MGGKEGGKEGKKAAKGEREGDGVPSISLTLSSVVHWAQLRKDSAAGKSGSLAPGSPSQLP